MSRNRRILVHGSAVGVVNSTGIGVYNVGQYARLVGAFSVTGSATVRWRMGAQSGSYIVTSSTIVNSGPSTLDVVNFGSHVEFSFTQANSQAASYLIMGEQVR